MADQAKPGQAARAVDLIVVMEAERDPIYILGRLIAVAEWLEYVTNGEAAEGKLALRTLERVQEMPQRCYVELGRIAHDRLGRIRQRHMRPWWWVQTMDRLLTQVAAEVGTDLPARLTHIQAGRATLGYQHQRAALFATSLRKTKADYEEAAEAAKEGAARLVAAGMSEVEAAERIGINRLTLRRYRETLSE